MWQVATFVIAMAAGMHLHTALDRVLRLDAPAGQLADRPEPPRFRFAF